MKAFGNAVACMTLAIAPWCVVSPAYADIAADLKACFNLPDPEDSKTCFVQLREKDQARRHDAAAKANKRADDLREVITNNLEPNYITFGSGIHAGGDRTTAAMLYEAQVFQNIEGTKGSFPKNSAGKRLDYWVDFPVRIGVRQLSTQSYPVRTPSYNPGLRLFVAMNDESDLAKPSLYYSLGLHHYSNGQETDVLKDDRLANAVNGSFNTNYVELAAHAALDLPYPKWARLAYRQHLFGTWEPIQKLQYPKQHLALELASRVWEFKAVKTQLRWTETFGWGYGFVKRPGDELTDAGRIRMPGQKASARDKLNSTLELSLKFTALTELAWYLRYDLGYDYYNINFQNRINRVQFGIVAR